MKRIFLTIIIITLVVVAAYWWKTEETIGQPIMSNLPDKGDRYEVSLPQTLSEQGESKVEMIKERAEVRLKKWNGEINLGVSYGKINAIAETEGNAVKWTQGKEDLRTYILDPKEGMEDGGLEIEIVLNEKSAINKFDFTIDGADEL